MWKRFTGLATVVIALLLVTAACASAPATEVAVVDDQAAEEVDDHATEEVDDHATEEVDDHATEEVDDHATEEVDDHATEEASSDADRILEVELNEFDILAASFAFTPGETVEFAITNSGVVEHEFRLSNAHRVEEHLEQGHDDHDDEEQAEAEAGHAGEAADAVLVLAPGESGTLMFTFPDNQDDYTAAVCLIPGHYEAGMSTDLAY